MLFRFCLYGFLKNQRYFEPFLILAFRDKGLSFAAIGLLVAFRDICINLLEVPTGAVADALGRRTAMICSHVAYVAAFWIFGMADRVWFLVPAMFAFALGEAFRTGTHKAIIFSWLKQQGRAGEKTRIYGITRSWSKAGSAVAVMVGAILVFWRQEYRLVFWLSMIPAAVNITNFLCYPRSLEGRRTLAQRQGIRQALRIGMHQCIRHPPLRRLLIESMGFEGAFNVSKNYLQPVIRQAALALPLLMAFEQRQRTALLVGSVYVVLHLLSSAASRQSHRFAGQAGGNANAARQLWLLYFAGFAGMAVGITLHIQALALGAFVLLAVLQNLWRPLLVGRVADESTDDAMATVLSVESQSKTFFAIVAAPLLGFAVDHMATPLRFLPVALLGLGVCALALLYTRPAGSRKIAT